MTAVPVLYALRDLTEATKSNAWEAVQAAAQVQGCPVNWSMCVTLEAMAFGHLDLEHAFWRVLQEPWLGPDPEARRLVGDGKLATFALHHRDALRRTLEEGESFLALACPRLVDHAASAGFRIQRIHPTVAQICAFTPEEMAHHRASLFPVDAMFPVVAAGLRKRAFLPSLQNVHVHA